MLYKIFLDFFFRQHWKKYWRMHYCKLSMTSLVLSCIALHIENLLKINEIAYQFFLRSEAMQQYCHIYSYMVCWTSKN